MKKVKQNGLRAEYRRDDLGRGLRGKYHKAYTSGTTLVLLGADVAEVFPDEAAVNNALRSLIKVARSAGRAKHGNGRSKKRRAA
jgi:hypothetical protein